MALPDTVDELLEPCEFRSKNTEEKIRSNIIKLNAEKHYIDYRGKLFIGATLPIKEAHNVEVTGIDTLERMIQYEDEDVAGVRVWLREPNEASHDNDSEISDRTAQELLNVINRSANGDIENLGGSVKQAIIEALEGLGYSPTRNIEVEYTLE